MKRVRNLPRNDGTNGWSRILPPRDPRSPLKGDTTANWLVIGAGYAGLAAARRLAENRPDDRIVLIDAAEVGEGASGRNSGFVIDLPHNVGGDADDLDAAHRALRLARTATEVLGEVVESHGIACQWSPRGQYMGAASAAGEAALGAFTAGLDALGEPYEDHREGLRARVGADHYRRIIHTPGTILMQPAALVRGLADSLPPNVSLYENTPAIAVDFSGPVRVETPGGVIRADKAILAVNGFAPEFGFWRNRFFSLGLFCSITRPLTAAEHAELGCEADWGLVPALAFGGPTIRYTQDRRLTMRSLFRWRPGMRARPSDFAAARALQERQLAARYPALPAGAIEHTWSGFITMSKNFAPGFGRRAPHVWTAVCQNGVGVTKGTISGLLAADMATGRDNPLIADMEALGAPNRLPPRPFLDLGVLAMMRKMQREQRSEA